MEHLTKTTGHRRKELQIACDNTAVVHVVNNCYSTTQIGQQLLKRLFTALEAAECIVFLVSIGTKENYADIFTRPSRLKPRSDPNREAAAVEGRTKNTAYRLRENTHPILAWN